MKPIRFHPEAEKELEQASDYYESQKPGLGSEFEAEIQTKMSLLALMPDSFPQHKRSGFRKCLVDRFPFTPYFLNAEDRIWIMAVVHQKRRPDYWIGRTPLVD